MTNDAISTFQKNLRGGLIQPGDAQYDEVRALYNGMIDKRPRMIARCVDVADVIATVNFGREQGLLIAIRGGGHNGPGLGSVNDGLVIDLSLMKSVRVDPANTTVRVGPGCTSGDVDHATHAFGLAVPFGIVSTTGIAGLTLGGGTGYLTRKFGLTIDNLLEADVVLADGRFVTASKDQHPDLFWALRGGGGNFGVVTSFLFQAHPVNMVYAGPIFWEASPHAKTVMRAYRDFLPTAPEELGIFVGLKTVPPTDPFPKDYWGKRACAIIGAYNGSCGRWRARDGSAPQGSAAADLQLDGRHAIPRHQRALRPVLSERPAVVLEGRLREIAARRSHRHAHRAGGCGTERLLADAPLPHRRRRPARREQCHRVEHARRDVQHGDRRHRFGSEECRCAEEVGARILEGRASLQSRRRVRELHDGRRGEQPC